MLSELLSKNPAGTHPAIRLGLIPLNKLRGFAISCNLMEKKDRYHSPIIRLAHGTTIQDIQSILYANVKIQRLAYHLYRSNTESVEFLYFDNLLSLKADRLAYLGWHLVGTGKRKMRQIIKEHDLSQIMDDPEDVKELRKYLRRLFHNNPLFSVALSRIQADILAKTDDEPEAKELLLTADKQRSNPSEASRQLEIKPIGYSQAQEDGSFFFEQSVEISNRLRFIEDSDPIFDFLKR